MLKSLWCQPNKEEANQRRCPAANMTSGDERHADTVAWLVTDGIWHPLLFVPLNPTANVHSRRKKYLKINKTKVNFQILTPTSTDRRHHEKTSKAKKEKMIPGEEILIKTK